MKILYLLQDFPYPPSDGVRLTPYNLIAYMAKSHECHVLAFGGPIRNELIVAWQANNPGLVVLGVYDNNRGPTLLRKQVEEIIRGHPLSLARWESHSFRVAIQDALRAHEYDLVHLDMINMAQYLPDVMGLPTVCSFNDASSRLYPQIATLPMNPLLRWGRTIVGRRLRDYESEQAQKATCIRLVSSVDARYLNELAPSAQIEVIGITLDERLFRIPPATGKTGNPVIFSAGHLSPGPNALLMLRFIQEEFPRIRRYFPKAELHLLSRKVSVPILCAASREPGIVVTNWVEDYAEALRQASVALFLDAAGTGMKNRVVQAMGAGRAVVATSVAFESIPVSHRVSALICESSREAGDQVLYLLQHDSARAEMGAKARELARKCFDPAIVGAQWEALYRCTVERFHSSGRVPRMGTPTLGAEI